MQGDALGTALLVVVLEKVTGDTETSLNGAICNRTRQYVAHAVDVLTFGHSVMATDAVMD